MYAILKPIIQGKVDMNYPHAGEKVKILQREFCGKWDREDDPLYRVEYANGELGWWNKRDLQKI